MPGDARPPFEPGKSPNPGGRPKSTPDMVRARELARAAAPDMVNGLIEIAKGSPDDHARIKAMNAVLDRALGKPVQAVEGTDDGPAIRVNLGPTIMIPPESSE